MQMRVFAAGGSAWREGCSLGSPLPCTWSPKAAKAGRGDIQVIPALGGQSPASGLQSITKRGVAGIPQSTDAHGGRGLCLHRPKGGKQLGVRVCEGWRRKDKVAASGSPEAESWTQAGVLVRPQTPAARPLSGNWQTYQLSFLPQD